MCGSIAEDLLRQVLERRQSRETATKTVPEATIEAGSETESKDPFWRMLYKPGVVLSLVIIMSGAVVWLLNDGPAARPSTSAMPALSVLLAKADRSLPLSETPVPGE